MLLYGIAFFVLLACLQTAALAAAGALSPSDPLDVGFRHMYNLKFREAHYTFQSWERFHPDDPLGPTSDAAAYLFDEFDRLGVLQSEFLADDERFERREKVVPDPAIREGFERALAQSDRLADALLAHSPNNEDALFAKVLNQGMRADYLALIDRRDLASLGRVKRAGLLAQQLLAADPQRYDAYLALGVENYLLSLKPVPVRWVLHFCGVETNKERGIKDLEVTAEKGHYLQPYARMLLAVAALRDHQRDRARALLQGLAQEFPENHLCRRELARLE
jgi:hypothetical protein